MFHTFQLAELRVRVEAFVPKTWTASRCSLLWFCCVCVCVRQIESKREIERESLCPLERASLSLDRTLRKTWKRGLRWSLLTLNLFFQYLQSRATVPPSGRYSYNFNMKETCGEHREFTRCSIFSAHWCNLKWNRSRRFKSGPLLSKRTMNIDFRVIGRKG